MSSTSTQTLPPLAPSGLLRDFRFDGLLIIGTLIVAAGCAGFAVMQPQWFNVLLWLDLWLLGFHHVIATFTRLAFDRKSLRENRFMALVLPWLVLGGTLGLCVTLGVRSVGTIYLYWQWFHYTRQSYGVMRMYERKGNTPEWQQRMNWWAIYALPLFGILYKSYQQPGSFLGIDVWYLPVSEYVLWPVGVIAMVITLAWAIGQVRANREGTLSRPLMLFMMSHFAIFAIGYIRIRSIDHGWLAINIWHNAQYILVVWMYNNGRFRKGVDREHRLISTLSQSRFLNVIGYFATCLVISTVVYTTLRYALRVASDDTALIAAVVTYQAINFHHYIVDGMIWKRKRMKPAAATA